MACSCQWDQSSASLPGPVGAPWKPIEYGKLHSNRLSYLQKQVIVDFLKRCGGNYNLVVSCFMMSARLSRSPGVRSVRRRMCLVRGSSIVSYGDTAQ